MSFFHSFLFAAAQPAPAQPSSPFALGGMLIPLVLIFVVMYFMLIWPQRRKDQERRKMLDNLQRNDHVATIGGMHGVITSIKEDEVVLRVDDAKDIRLRFSRSAIARVLKKAEGETPEQTDES